MWWSVAQSCPILCNSIDFSQEEYWSGLPFPPPGNLPNPGFKPVSPALASRFFTIVQFSSVAQLCPILCDPHRGQPTRLPRPLDSPYKFKQKFQLPWIIFSVNKWRDWIGVNGIYNHFHLGKRNFYFTFVSKEKILLLLPFKNHPYLHMASALPSWYFIILFHTYCMNKNTRLVIDSEWLKVNKLT